MNNIYDNIAITFSAIRYYAFFKNSHKMGADELKDYQIKKIQTILNYSNKRVPYYKNLFRKIGFDPQSFRYLEDIKEIPFLDNNTVRKNPQLLLSEDWKKLGVRFVNTSGSTGTPLSIALDRSSRAAKYAIVYKLRNIGGYKLYNRAFSLWGVYATSKKKPYGIDRVKNILYYANNKMTENNNCEVGRLLNIYRPVQFEGYAWSFLELGLCLKKRNIPVHSPRSIFCYGDGLSDELRKTLAELFNTQVFDFYSNTENAALISEFHPGERFLMEDYFYPEICPESNNANLGELVGTSFYNYAMPFIRYKTKDLIELETDSKSEIPFRKVKRLVGRQDDYLLMSDGRKILSAQRAIYGIDTIITAQFIQYSTKHISINLIVEDNFDKDCIKSIEHKMYDILGETIQIDFNIVKELEKNSAGKTPFIIREM